MQDPQSHSQASKLRNVLVERDYLSEREVDLLMEAARPHRWGHRDATAILVAYQHELRASELVALRWDDIDLTTGRLRIRRANGVAPALIRFRPRSRWPCADCAMKPRPMSLPRSMALRSG